MSTKTAAFNLQPSNLLAAGAIGAGIGVGGRTLKNLWDIWHNRDIESPVAGKMPKQVSNHAQIPVEVTPEEAKELEAQGVHVKAAESSEFKIEHRLRFGKEPGFSFSRSAPSEKIKKTWLKEFTSSPKMAGDLGFLDKFMLGAAGTGAAALGWKALDPTFDKQRMDLAQTKLDRTRERVRALLAGNAMPQDTHLGNAMKVAEDAMIKEASIVGAGISGIDTALGTVPGLGYASGIGAALVAANAFNEARKRNKSLNNAKAMAEYARTQPTKPPVAELVPTLGKIGRLLTEADLRQAADSRPDYKEKLERLRERRGDLKGKLNARIP